MIWVFDFNGVMLMIYDFYVFLLMMSDFDLYFFGEGNFVWLYDKLGV